MRMPKRSEKDKKKPKKGRGRGSDDESVNGDSGSVVSSDRGSHDDFNGDVEGDVEEILGVDSKVAEAVDMLTEKGGRGQGLVALTNLLANHYLPEALVSRRETLRDALERTLKRGNSTEQALAAKVGCLAAIQVASFDFELASEDLGILRPLLDSILLDHTASLSLRTTVCEYVCLAVFLSDSLEEAASLLKILEGLFRVEGLAGSAVAGWSLVLTLLPVEVILKRATEWVRTLVTLLDQQDLEVRLRSGEALAILSEIADFNDEEGELDIDIDGIIAKLRELSVESVKYRTKKDRRQQRHSFRDYLRALEDGEGPDLSIKFGLGQVLELDSWGKKKAYDCLAQLVGGGINRHLTDNVFVRGLFTLGPPKLVVGNGKIAKAERHFANAESFKARSVQRAKSRDHRMAANEF